MNPLFHNYLILNKWDRDATASQVKELFGLKPNTPWPKAGVPLQVIQGTSCWVYPLQPGKGFKLRAYCSCKFCGKAVPIGRLHQHVLAHAASKACNIRVEAEHGDA